MTDLKPMTAAVIGCGPRGVRHVLSTRDLECIEWLGGCDLSAERRQVFADETELPVFADIEGVLKQSPDIVAIVTNVESHVPLGCQAAEAGAHLVMEKPLSTSVAEGRRLVDLARERRRQAAVSFQLRYHPFAIEMRRRCEQIEPLLVHHSRHSGLMRDVFLRPGRFTGVFDYLVHEIDIIRWWTGSGAAAVSAQIGCGIYSDAGAPDLASLHMELDGELPAAATLVASMAGPPLSRTTQVAGRLGAIEARFGGELRWSQGREPAQAVDIPPASIDGTAALYLDLVRAIQGEPAPDMPTLQDGLAAVAVIEAAFNSAAEKRRVGIAAEDR